MEELKPLICKQIDATKIINMGEELRFDRPVTAACERYISIFGRNSNLKTDLLLDLVL